MEKICVYGSITIDMSVQVNRFPKPGEELKGEDFVYRPGGKGANQAVSAAKLGANVQLISVVGFDAMGINMLEKIRRQGVGTRYVGRYPSKTNITMIFDSIRDAEGEPAMMLFSDSKKHLNAKHLERSFHAIDSSGILMLQLSSPMDGVLLAAQRMKKKQGLVILDPAPPIAIPDELLKCVDILTPNQKELAAASGIKNACENDEMRMKAAKKFLDHGVKYVINKAGENGAYIMEKDSIEHVPAFHVHSGNTWGVGSVFNSGLAVGLARGIPVQDAVRFANAACALTILNGGSQDGVPDYQECADLLNGRMQLPELLEVPEQGGKKIIAKNNQEGNDQPKSK